MSSRHIGAIVSDKKPFRLRLPEELKAWIEDQAGKNGSSQNSEIIRAIRERAERLQTSMT
jgi:predicted HicB family RNase H-like nuclease